VVEEGSEKAAENVEKGGSQFNKEQLPVIRVPRKENHGGKMARRARRKTHQRSRREKTR